MRWATHYQAIVENAPDPILLVDAEGRIVLANARACSVFGYHHDDIVGAGVERLVPAAARAHHVTLRADYLDAPIGRSFDDRAKVVYALHRDGSEFPVEISLAPIDAGEGQVTMAVLRDVTERIELQQESLRLRDELIATVSHELRTPLTSIIGYAELMADLDETQLSPSARRLLGIIQRNASRELKLVDDLLTMAFLDDNRMQVNRARVCLADLTSAALEDVSVRAAERGQELRVTRDAPCIVLGDALRLEQAVENVLDNAVKFTDRGGTIEIRVWAEEGQAILEVRDEGLGFDAAEREHLFDRLYRTPAAAAAQIQGAGLGLAIVKAIIEAHGGDVWAEGASGEGACFRLMLPLASD